MARTLDPEGAHLEALRRFADFDGLRAVDDHDARQYLPSGEELVEHVAQSLRSAAGSWSPDAREDRAPVRRHRAVSPAAPAPRLISAPRRA